MIGFVRIIFVFSFVLTQTWALWRCEIDDDCSDLEGGICVNNDCICPIGHQVVNGGRKCAEIAPYHFSRCEEDFQCSRLFTGFQCYINKETGEGTCQCDSGHHYFLGRCWRTRDLGESCSRDEECRSPVLNNPFAMQCRNDTCVCSDGYFLRQRGECRRIGFAVGEGCVLDVDCQFPNGVCDFRSRTCYDSTIGMKSVVPAVRRGKHVSDEITFTHIACRDNGDCDEPLICSNVGICTCPPGYYRGSNNSCFAEIGSPATEDTCVGLFNILVDGRCVCPANFFSERSMRDCVKASIRFTDSCITDDMCHTFGAASYCGPPGEWRLRRCLCNETEAVLEEHTSMCRLFSAIGEYCEVDDDCMAGNVQIECRLYEDGYKRCACPEGLTPVGNLCLQDGLVLGDECQVSEECTGTKNSTCAAGICVCDEGFRQSGNYCLPVIGTACTHNDDCVIGNSTCQANEDAMTCQCMENFVTHYDECWEVSAGYAARCSIDKQCQATLGEGSVCEEGLCECKESFHLTNNFCWRKVGLREPCTSRSECYLGDYTERVICRNSFCECHFDFPYDEDLNTCGSSASGLFGNVLLLLLTIFVIKNYLRN